MTDFNYEQLQPGIRNAVRWFHQKGYVTTDSGDGSLFKKGVEGAMKEPMVAVIMPDWDNMVYDSLRLAASIRDTGIEGDVEVYVEFNEDKVPVVIVSGEGLLELGDEERSRYENTSASQ